jgi:hypothetical protein
MIDSTSGSFTGTEKVDGGYRNLAFGVIVYHINTVKHMFIWIYLTIC